MNKLFLLLLLISSSLYSVLPPFYESKAELEAILKDPTLEQYLSSGDVILSIKHDENQWIIEGSRNRAVVYVEYLKQDRPGPQQFTFKWSK